MLRCQNSLSQPLCFRLESPLLLLGVIPFWVSHCGPLTGAFHLSVPPRHASLSVELLLLVTFLCLAPFHAQLAPASLRSHQSSSVPTQLPEASSTSRYIYASTCIVMGLAQLPWAARRSHPLHTGGNGLSLASHWRICGFLQPHIIMFPAPDLVLSAGNWILCELLSLTPDLSASLQSASGPAGPLPEPCLYPPSLSRL